MLFSHVCLIGAIGLYSRCTYHRLNPVQYLYSDSPCPFYGRRLPNALIIAIPGLAGLVSVAPSCMSWGSYFLSFTPTLQIASL